MSARDNGASELPRMSFREGDSIIDPFAYTDINQQIADVDALRQKKQYEFERWLLENPQAVQEDDDTFQWRRQELKMLDLKLAELREIKANYPDHVLLQSTVIQTPETAPLVRSTRANVAAGPQRGARPVGRPTHKVARG